MKRVMVIMFVGLIAGAACLPGRCGEDALPQWIWFPEIDMDPLAEAPTESRYFVRTFDLDSAVKSASIEIAVDNSYELYVNGKSIGQGDNWQQAAVFDIAANLKKGKNTIAVMAANAGGPAGWIMAGKVVTDKGTKVDLSTNSGWLASDKEVKGWLDGNIDKSWVKALELGEYGCSPWGTNVQSEMLSQ